MPRHAPKAGPLRLLSALVLGAILLSTPASASAAERTGRLLVLVDQHARSRDTTSALQRLGARRAGEQVPEVGLVTVRPAGRTLAATAAALRELPGVSSVTPERRYSARFTPNDPALTQPEPAAADGRPRQWWVARENLPAAWDITRGTGAKVAIIDSGIDGGHPEFAGKVAAALDNDGRPSSGVATYDASGHGTHVASLACAAGDNGIGIVGAGLNCSLIVVQSDLTDSSVAKSIVDATNLGADAINMSFGYEGNEPPPPVIREAVDYAIDHDVVLVAAAKNAPVQEQSDPANILQPTGTGPDITFNKGLSVTSASFSNTRSSFAGKGSQISLAAYGSSDAGPAGILGAAPSNRTELDVACGSCRTTLDGDNRYVYLKGTSMAAPQVSAIAALVANLNPDLTAAAIVRLLKQTATRPAGSSWSADLGWGIVNGGAALVTARRMDRRAPTSKARGPKRLRSRTTFTLKWTGKDRAPPGVITSGIRRYEIYRKKNGGKYRRIASTTKKRMKIRTARGARYRFYTIAVDRRGNHEKPPARADVTLTVSRRR